MVPEKKVKIKSIMLVGIQAVCLFFLLSHNKLIEGKTLADLTLFTAVIIGVLAIYQFRKSKFNIFPIPKNESTLINAGIYKYIRHPIYTALIMFGISKILINPDYMNILFTFVLTITLEYKSLFEEALLIKKFPKYREYLKQTKKFIPFIY